MKNIDIELVHEIREIVLGEILANNFSLNMVGSEENDYDSHMMQTLKAFRSRDDMITDQRESEFAEYRVEGSNLPLLNVLLKMMLSFCKVFVHRVYTFS